MEQMLQCGALYSYSAANIRVITRVSSWKMYKILVGKPQRKKSRRRPRSEFQDNIKLNLT